MSATTARPEAGARLDGAYLLLVPGVVLVLALFIYPFLFGVGLSFHPLEGGALADYQRFFTDPRLWRTIPTTLGIAVPATLINLGLALPVAYRMRVPRPGRKLLTTILVVPITLGTVLVADGLLSYLGPQGWFNRTLAALHLASHPIALTHNYWGVLLSLVVTGFPFAFLLLLSFISGVDPLLSQAAATLGATPRAQFWRITLPLVAPGVAMTFCLVFVQAFSVFPSAVLLGAPAGPTRVISIAAYEAAFEQYDYPLASAIAILMGLAQLVIVAAVLALRGALYRGPVSGGKG
jgi:putative spermidine/putrescine transport system permease protein